MYYTVFLVSNHIIGETIVFYFSYTPIPLYQKYSSIPVDHIINILIKKRGISERFYIF